MVLDARRTRVVAGFEKMVLSKDKTTLKVNDALTHADVPAETTQYRLGNRSALEWVVDPYRVTRDKAKGAIASDPERRGRPALHRHPRSAGGGCQR